MVYFTRIAGKVKDFVKQYGRTGLMVYLGVSTVSIGASYMAVRAGVDGKALVKRVSGIELSDNQENLGTFIGAYAIHKLLLPVRLSLTVFLTGMITKWRKGPNGNKIKV